MSENKTGKYLKYALGEILLVMIGILLALQVNNWNEERKMKAVEIEVLTDIKNALKSDLDNQFLYHLENIRHYKVQVMNILDLIEYRKPYDDSLKIDFRVITSAGPFNWAPYLTVYKQLENKGVDVIRNDSLQRAILDIYNDNYPKIEALLENYRLNIYDYGRPIARRKFKTNRGKNSKPINFDILANDVEFYNTVGILNANLGDLETLILRSRSNVEEVINYIEEELKSKY